MHDLQTSSSSSIGPLSITNPPGDTPPPNTTDVYGIQLTGSAWAQVKDVLTLRARGGWACGDWMPYFFGGLAVGRMDVYRNVTSATTLRQDVTIKDAAGNSFVVTGPTNTIASMTTSATQERTNNFVPGWTAGLGFEYKVWGDLFVRAEYEYVRFVSVENVNVALNSARAGIGYKF
jgi:opacity protein-like surface antigen